MKKINLFLAFCVICSVINAQQTTLTIDNQTPGWLSSKINYGDQLTVKNLTVIGYINSTDLEFIGTLISKSLKGYLDLENVTIVKDSENNDNIFPESAFKLSDCYELGKLSLPSTLSSMGNWNLKLDSYSSEESLKIDTLIIGGKNISRLMYYNICNCSTLYIREGVDSLGTYTSDIESLDIYTTSAYPNLKKVSLPNSIKFIGNGFFRNCSEINSMNLPESLEEIHSGAFQGTKFLPNVLCLPKNIKNIHIGAFYKTDVTEFIFSETLQNIGVLYSDESTNTVPVFKEVKIHFKGNVPGVLRMPSTGSLRPRPLPAYVLSNWTIYVPNDYMEDYAISRYKTGNLISEIEIENIEFKVPDKMYIGDRHTLSANYIPTEATDNCITWRTDSNNIISLMNNIVIAKNFGKANIISLSSFGKVNSERYINIYEHVLGIDINDEEVIMNIGTSQKLIVNLYPRGKTDGEVMWTSDNPEIANITEQGVIVAKSIGKCNIICKSVDGGFEDYCTIIVKQPVTGITLDKQNIEMSYTGEMVQLQANVLPENASNTKISWSSSNENVCRVFEGGLVIALSEGTSDIIATTEDGDYTAVCQVKVDLSSAINELSNNNIKITYDKNILRVHNKPMEEKLSIYTTDGKLIYNGTDNYYYLKKGTYIVIIGKFQQKVIVTD